MSVSRPPSRLLLATERTEFDRGAERVAIALARALATTLPVVRPFATNEELLTTEPTLALAGEANAAADLHALVSEARIQGVVATPTVRRGALLWQEILAAAADETELLITRRVGRRGLLERLLVGEMVSRVAAQAPCPVLMVPATAAGLWTRRVIVPAAANRRLEGAAAALAAVCGARVESRTGALAEVASAAEGADLLALGLSAEQIAAGRLRHDVVAAIGAAPCPVLLVGPVPRTEA